MLVRRPHGTPHTRGAAAAGRGGAGDFRWCRALGKGGKLIYINVSSMKQEDKGGGVNFNLRLIVSEFASKEAARLSMDRIEWRGVLVTALKET